MKTNLVLQYYGNGFAVGISGTKQAITEAANRFFNWGMTESEPHFTSDTFAYVLSDEPRMVRFFALMTLLRMGVVKNISDAKGLRRILAARRWNHVIANATAKVAALPKETFIPEAFLSPEAEAYQIGNMDHSGLDE